jgi:hypothetical protein
MVPPPIRRIGADSEVLAAQSNHMGFVNVTIAPSRCRCASRTSSRAKRGDAASSSHCNRARPDWPTFARPAQPAAVIRAAVVPGAPLITAVAVTGVPDGTRNVCPGPAMSAAALLGQDAVSSSATSRDRARYERPRRSPSMIAGIDSSDACTAVCGEPTGWCLPCESLPPIATMRRPRRSSRCQMRSDSSSSTFHRPFQT